MIIRREQFATLAAGWERAWHTAFMVRLRDELPVHVGAIPQQDLQKQVEDGCKAAALLAITDTDHVYRFLRLRYLPASVWERTAAQEMMVRVLTDTSIEAGLRLRFVETNMRLARSEIECEPFQSVAEDGEVCNADVVIIRIEMILCPHVGNEVGNVRVIPLLRPERKLEGVRVVFAKTDRPIADLPKRNPPRRHKRHEHGAGKIAGFEPEKVGFVTQVAAHLLKNLSRKAAPSSRRDSNLTSGGKANLMHISGLATIGTKSASV
jgi:hypothetical protein